MNIRDARKIHFERQHFSPPKTGSPNQTTDQDITNQQDYRKGLKIIATDQGARLHLQGNCVGANYGSVSRVNVWSNDAGWTFLTQRKEQEKQEKARKDVYKG